MVPNQRYSDIHSINTVGILVTLIIEKKDQYQYNKNAYTVIKLTVRHKPGIIGNITNRKKKKRYGVRSSLSPTMELYTK